MLVKMGIDILLISPSMAKIKPVQLNPPMSLLYIEAVLREHGYSSKILDCNVKNINASALNKIIHQYKPRFVGITMMTCQIYNGIRIARDIKKYFADIQIIGGGSHISASMEELFHFCDSFNYLVYGEGEYTILEIIKGILISNINGIIYQKNEMIVTNKPRQYIKDLDQLPYPDHSVVKLEHYANDVNSKNGYLTIQMSRGCPYSCTYCGISCSHGKKPRIRSVKNTIDEIEYNITRFGIRNYKFIDGAFTINRKFVEEFCSGLKSRKIQIQWRCLTRVDLVDKQLLSLMKNAGCNIITFGIESGSDKVLDTINKGYNTKEVIKAVEICNQIGLSCGAYFLIGCSGETIKDVEHTIRLAKRLKLDYAVFSVMEALPGTAAFNEAVEKGQLSIKDYYRIYREHYTNNINYDQLSIDDQKYLKRRAYFEFYFTPRQIIKNTLEVRTIRSLEIKIKGLRRMFSQNL